MLRQEIENILGITGASAETKQRQLDRICDAIGKVAEGMPHCKLEEYDTLDANINNATKVQLESGQAYWQKEIQ